MSKLKEFVAEANKAVQALAAGETAAVALGVLTGHAAVLVGGAIAAALAALAAYRAENPK